MKVLRPRWNQSCRCHPVPQPQPQQPRICAASVTYTTAHRQCWSFNPLREARDWTWVLMDSSQVDYPWARMETPSFHFLRSIRHHQRSCGSKHSGDTCLTAHYNKHCPLSLGQLNATTFFLHVDSHRHRGHQGTISTEIFPTVRPGLQRKPHRVFKQERLVSQDMSQQLFPPAGNRLRPRLKRQDS